MTTPSALSQPCSKDPDGVHMWHLMDKWLDRARDGHTEYMSKFYCQYCLEIVVRRDRKGGRSDR